MRREIKFRAWDKTNKKFFYIEIKENKLTTKSYPLEKGTVLNPEIDTNWQQYTGLKDKHGKDVYEGDIVKSSMSHFTGIVYFERGSFWVKELFSNVDEGVYDGDIQKETVWSIDLDYKVIGTMYEHLELMEQS